MCGIVGCVTDSSVNQLMFDALTVLQHRGQDAAGMATADSGHFNLQKGNGLVRDVIRTRHMHYLKGRIGIGHVRYPTAGTPSEDEAQPFYVNSPYGIALAHNGNLTNAPALKDRLFKEDLRHINTQSDSEIILNIFAHELQKSATMQATPSLFFNALTQMASHIRGAYAFVALIANVGLLAMRDPFGIRPLIYGRRKNATGFDYMIASESVALTSQGFEIVRDLQPGEALLISEQGQVSSQVCCEKTRLSPCLFEFVYFARPDSIIDGISVYKVRKNIGTRLADKIIRDWPSHDIDVVIPVPETSRSSAASLASRLNVKCREGLVKNRYIGRTFIMPGQKARQRSVRQKLNAIDLEFKDKNVLLVDDSIVRGTTSKEIIQLAREAGAKKVYFASASPPIRYPNIYGIDMPCMEELVAHNRSLKDIETFIGADKLIYADLEDLVQVAKEGNAQIEQFESSIFDGVYATGEEREYLAQVALTRQDSALSARYEQSGAP